MPILACDPVSDNVPSGLSCLPARVQIFFKKRFTMIVEDLVHMIAGLFILISLALGTYLNPYFYLFTAFVGANLFQSEISKFCPLAFILKKMTVAVLR